mmetsp:Transcript_26065/g.74860  ORF Transcript_26065/g.74860 Transcript_26065/m.74860 type:complete len:352 (+) Transcript_26065:574-1629(+)
MCGGGGGGALMRLLEGALAWSSGCLLVGCVCCLSSLVGGGEPIVVSFNDGTGDPSKPIPLACLGGCSARSLLPLLLVSLLLPSPPLLLLSYGSSSGTFLRKIRLLLLDTKSLSLSLVASSVAVLLSTRPHPRIEEPTRPPNAPPFLALLSLCRSSCCLLYAATHPASDRSGANRGDSDSGGEGGASEREKRPFSIGLSMVYSSRCSDRQTVSSSDDSSLAICFSSSAILLSFSCSDNRAACSLSCTLVSCLVLLSSMARAASYSHSLSLSLLLTLPTLAVMQGARSRCSRSCWCCRSPSTPISSPSPSPWSFSSSSSLGVSSCMGGLTCIGLSDGGISRGLRGAWGGGRRG